MYIAMNCFKVIKGAESAFEHVWLSRDTHLDRAPGLWSSISCAGLTATITCSIRRTRCGRAKKPLPRGRSPKHFRAAHRDAGANKPLYPGHPEFEGFEAIQTIKNPNAGIRPPERRPGRLRLRRFAISVHLTCRETVVTGPTRSDWKARPNDDEARSLA